MFNLYKKGGIKEYFGPRCRHSNEHSRAVIG
jgi:hypothetical protein